LLLRIINAQEFGVEDGFAVIGDHPDGALKCFVNAKIAVLSVMAHAAPSFQ